MFNIQKLIQTVNYILKKYEYKLNYTKLIKLLYLADKEALKESNNAITGDTYVSMKNGPVLSLLYDLIKNKLSGTEMQNLWNQRFEIDGYALIALSAKIPEGKLSPFEKEILDRIDLEFHEMSQTRIIKQVQNKKDFPEWKDPGNGSFPIPMADILKSAGKTTEEAGWILQDNEAFDEEEKIFKTQLEV